MIRVAAEAPDSPSRPKDEACIVCGHWSVGTEYGLDDNSGYCDRWEKITSRTYWCDEFVSRADYDRYQQELAEEHEDYIDDDG